EEFGVLRIRKRPAAFDEVDSERIQASRDAELVAQRVRYPFALSAVAQRGIVNDDAIVCRVQGAHEPVCRPALSASAATPVPDCGACAGLTRPSVDKSRLSADR